MSNQNATQFIQANVVRRFLAAGPKPVVKGLEADYAKWMSGYMSFSDELRDHPVIGKDSRAQQLRRSGDFDALCEYLDKTYYWCPQRQGLTNKTAAGQLPTPIRNQVRDIAKRSLGNEDTSAINLVFDFTDKSDAEYAAKKIRALGVTLAIKPSEYNKGEYTMFIRGYDAPAKTASVENVVARFTEGVISVGMENLKTATDQHVQVNDLPVSLRNALKQVSYGRRDIRIETATTFRMMSPANDGERDFVLVVNMDSGDTKEFKGSFGGANMNSRNNPVDSDDSPRPIPMNAAIIRGTESSRPTYAYIVVSPENMAGLIPQKVTLTPDENMALAIVNGLISSYRKDAFDRAHLGVYGPNNRILVYLAAKGLVKLTKVGVSITTEGKSQVDRSIHV